MTHTSTAQGNSDKKVPFMDLSSNKLKAGLKKIIFLILGFK